MSAIKRAVDGIFSWFIPASTNASDRRMNFLEAGQFSPNGPQCGIEIINDDTTPMEFVVEVLQSELGLSSEKAIQAMSFIHLKGSILLPSNSLTEAQQVVDAIMVRSHEQSHDLNCRAVSAQQAVPADSPKTTSG